MVSDDLYITHDNSQISSELKQPKSIVIQSQAVNKTMAVFWTLMTQNNFLYKKLQINLKLQYSLYSAKQDFYLFI